MFKPRKFRQAENFDQKTNSDETAIDCSQWGDSLTIQSMAEDADINVIVARYGLTGSMPPNAAIPMYGDFTEITDYRTALRAIQEADERFMELPAQVRARFENDPQKLMDFAYDPRNAEELRALGFRKAAPPAPPEPTGGQKTEGTPPVPGMPK